MWIDSDAARSDFILAAAAYVLTPILVRSLVVRLPFYPEQSVTGLVLSILWVLIATTLVPVLLARHRGDGAAAFGLAGGASTGARGLVLAVPIVAVGVLGALPSGNLLQAALGRLSVVQRGGPTIPPQLVALGIVVLAVAALLIGGVALLLFLSVRAEDGFRGTEMSLTEALRTFGMGAAGIGLGFGLLNTVAGGAGWEAVVINALGVAALVLVADGIIPPGRRTTRAAILAPTTVVLVGFVFAAGGFFGGDLLGAVYAGSLGGGVTVVIASLVAAERGWAAVAPLAAIALYPTCLNPLVPPVPESFLVAAGC